MAVLGLACATAACVVAGLVVSPQLRHLLVHGRLPQASVQAHPLVQAFEPDGTTLRTCAEMPADPAQPRQLCRARALGNVSFDQGPARAFTELRQRLDSDPSWSTDTHISAHFIGAAALARRDGEAAGALSEGESLGGGGYYHGLMVQLLGDRPATSLPRIVRDTCHDAAITAVDYTRIKCYHGAGHGFLVVTGHDLPRALELCEGSATTIGETNNCAHGVFMENLGELYGLAAPGFRSPWLDQNDLEFPCSQVDERHRPFCYSHVASRAGPVFRWDWRRLGELCGTLPRRMNREACYQSVGLWASTRGDGAGDILDACAAAGGPQATCVSGAVKAIVNDDPRDRATIARADAVCEASDVEASCIRAIGTILRQVEPEVHAAACRRITTGHKAACREGEAGPVAAPQRIGS